jgi:hypothetical protein
LNEIKLKNSLQTGIQLQAENNNLQNDDQNIYQNSYIYDIIVQDNDLINNTNSINVLNAAYNFQPNAAPYQMVIIGGFEKNRGNRISNTDKGIVVGDYSLVTDSTLWKLPTGIRILHNDIDAKIIGIDLGNTGISQNIPTQTYLSTPGPNNWQNKPVLLYLNKISKCLYLLRGQLCSSPYEDYIIQVFANSRNPEKYPNGELFITQERVTSDELGFVSFEIEIKGKLCFPKYLTASATRLRTGDTSEFSSNSYPVFKRCECPPVEDIICERNPNLDIFLNAPTITVTATTDSGLNTLRQAIIDVNTIYQRPTIIRFLPNIGTIFLASELPSPLFPIKIDGQATSPNTALAPKPFNGGPNVIIEAISVPPANFKFISFLPGSDGSILKDLSIVKFRFQLIFASSYGIIQLSADNISVVGCYLGLYPGPNNQGNPYSVTGLGSTIGLSKILSGEPFSSSARNNIKIGGQNPRERNIIIGLSNTILIDGFFNNSLIEGNYVGVENTGTIAIPHMVSMNFRAILGVVNSAIANFSIRNQASVIVRKNLIGGGGSVLPQSASPVSPVAVNFSGGYSFVNSIVVLPSLMIDNIIGARWDGLDLLRLDGGALSLLPGTISLRSISTNSTIYNNLIVNNSNTGTSYNLKFEIGDGFNTVSLSLNNLVSFGHNLAIFNKVGVNKDETKSLGNSTNNAGDDINGIVFYNLFFNNTIGGANTVNILSNLNIIQGNFIGEKGDYNSDCNNNDTNYNLNLIYPTFTSTTGTNVQLFGRSTILRDNLISNCNINNVVSIQAIDISNNIIKNSAINGINVNSTSSQLVISNNLITNNFNGLSEVSTSVDNNLLIIDKNHFKKNTNYGIIYNNFGGTGLPVNASNVTFGSVITNNYFDENALYDIYFFYNGSLATTIRLFRMIFVGGFSEKDGNKFRKTPKGVVLINAIIGDTNLSPNSITINYNSIQNSDIGIDLGNNGPSVNLPQQTVQPTPGPNNWQNKPILVSLKSKHCSNLLSGILDSRPNETYIIQVFGNKEFSVNHPNGKVYITQKKVQTDSLGHVEFKIFFKGILKNPLALTATATSLYTGDTSEFSNNSYSLQ